MDEMRVVQNGLGGGSYRSSWLKKFWKRIVVGVVLVVVVGVGLSFTVSAVRNIFIESSQIVDIQVGNDKISQVYVGSTLVWERCAYPGQRFDYTGGAQTFTAPCDGLYEIELWGAQGGSNSAGSMVTGGGYSRGTISLDFGDNLYIFVGSKGGNAVNMARAAGGYNGGGGGGLGNNLYPVYPDRRLGGAGGGGATDVRLVNGTWNSAAGLRSRIMVAGGGGGFSSTNSPYGGHGGGLSGTAGVHSMGCGNTGYYGQTIAAGTQTSGYNIGIGRTGTDKEAVNTVDVIVSCGVQGNSGGGGGYYGGQAGTATIGTNGTASGAGGSGYVSGLTGAVAMVSASSDVSRTGTGGAICDNGTLDNLCSVHYSGKVFSDALMIVGNSVMPSPSGGSETGHVGNGVARITYLGVGG